MQVLSVLGKIWAFKQGSSIRKHETDKDVQRKINISFRKLFAFQSEKACLSVMLSCGEK